MRFFGFPWIKSKAAWHVDAQPGRVATAALAAGLFCVPAFSADCAKPDTLAMPGQAVHDRVIGAGFAMGSEFLWAHHYEVYWDLTRRTDGEEMNPPHVGALNAGNHVD